MVEQTRHSSWDDFADRYAAEGGRVEGGNRPAAGDSAGARQRRQRESVQVATFTGNDRRQQARAAANRLRLEHDVPGVWYAEAGAESIIYAGRHLDSGDTRGVRRLLGRIRKIREDGDRPYADAALVRLGAGTAGPAGSGSPLDLRTHRGMYSLQIAHYDSRHPEERHLAAEEHARRLNDGKLRAFYYHGPKRSLVTVGLFGERDFVQVRSADGGHFEREYGPAIQKLQKAHPLNLGNGEPVMIPNPRGGDPIPQPSALVRSR